MERITVKVIAEYGMFTPLWVVGDDGILEPQDYQDLPISHDLEEAMVAWFQRYLDTYVPDDPRSSGFDSPGQDSAFEKEGLQLCKRLAGELGPQYLVEYHSELVEP